MRGIGSQIYVHVERHRLTVDVLNRFAAFLHVVADATRPVSRWIGRSTDHSRRQIGGKASGRANIKSTCVNRPLTDARAMRSRIQDRCRYRIAVGTVLKVTVGGNRVSRRHDVDAPAADIRHKAIEFPRSGLSRRSCIVLSNPYFRRIIRSLRRAGRCSYQLRIGCRIRIDLYRMHSTACVLEPDPVGRVGDRERRR